MYTFVVLLSLAPIGNQPVYAVREYADVTIVGINPETQRLSVTVPTGGSQSLTVSTRTWIIQQNGEGTFASLHVRQHLHVWFIPRGGQAAILEILPTKSTNNTGP